MNDKCWYKEVCNLDTCDNCIRFIEMSFLMQKSNIPYNRQFPKPLIPQDCDYDSYCKLAKIKENVVEFVDEGKQLYITSRYTGNGKTSWAIKLMLKYFDGIWAGNGCRIRGLFIHTPTFLTKLKQFDVKDIEFEELKRNIIDCDLVVWDDIGANDMSAYDHTQLLTYIDQRVLNNKSNIYTGNLNKTLLERSLGVRLASRITSGEFIELRGKDMR